MILLEKLLAPVSAEKPCGEDVSYDSAFQELETLVIGKPETQFSAAEPPDWKEVRDRTAELLARSKHLRLSIIFAAALLRVDGLAGLKLGLTLIQRMIASYWPALFPALDPEDDNDPTERLNILGALSMPQASFGDPLQFVQGIRLAPLTHSRQLGRFNLEDITNSLNGVESTREKPVPGKAEIQGAFLDTSPETLEASQASVAQCLATLKELRTALSEAVGSGEVPAFEALTNALKELQKVFLQYAPKNPGADAAMTASPEPVESFAPVAPASRPPGVLEGTVETREQVVQALDLVCSYYSQHEPSSPIPLLLQRAKRLVQADFLGIVSDLYPESLGQFQQIAGIK